MDEGSPLGRILFGPYNTNVSHGSVKLQCAPAVIPVMLELLQRGYLLREPQDINMREKLEFYGLDVRVSLHTRVVAPTPGPLLPPTQTLDTEPRSRGATCANNDRYLFDVGDISTTLVTQYERIPRVVYWESGESTQIKEFSRYVRFVDFSARGEKRWSSFSIPPHFAFFSSYAIAAGEDPVIALYSSAHTRVCVVEFSDSEDEDEDADAGTGTGTTSDGNNAPSHLLNMTPNLAALREQKGVDVRIVGELDQYEGSPPGPWKSWGRAETNFREVDVGTIPESVAVNDRYLAVCSLGAAHLFDLSTGRKVHTCPVRSSALALRGDKLILQLSAAEHAAHGGCIIDIPTGTPHINKYVLSKNCYNDRSWHSGEATCDGYPPGTFWARKPKYSSKRTDGGLFASPGVSREQVCLRMELAPAWFSVPAVKRPRVIFAPFGMTTANACIKVRVQRTEGSRFSA